MESGGNGIWIVEKFVFDISLKVPPEANDTILSTCLVSTNAKYFGDTLEVSLIIIFLNP